MVRSTAFEASILKRAPASSTARAQRSISYHHLIGTNLAIQNGVLFSAILFRSATLCSAGSARSVVRNINHYVYAMVVAAFKPVVILNLVPLRRSCWLSRQAEWLVVT